VQYTRIALFVGLMIGPNLAQRVYAAEDPLGLYVGAALGQSEVRVDESVFGGAPGFDAHRDAWKLLVGLRPISLLGAELDYMDFGHARFADRRTPWAPRCGPTPTGDPDLTSFGITWSF
jgi:hypothetical protein